MGAGKSTIGRHLAQQLHMEFVDSDTVIEERTGADIAWVFDVEGEEGFRKREEAVIEELTLRNQIVLATGIPVIRWRVLSAACSCPLLFVSQFSSYGFGIMDFFKYVEKKKN